MVPREHGRFGSPVGKLTLLLWLVCSPPARAQQIDVAVGATRNTAPLSLFDEIRDSSERSAFRRLWTAPDPAARKRDASAFVQRYPRSVVLQDAYEIAARASLALGQDSEALDWAQHSLRYLPENPFLLAMAANVAARLGQYDWAESAARRSLEYLDRAAPPAALSAVQWRSARDGAIETAQFVLGRSAAAAGHNQAAEKWLLLALAIDSRDVEALYALGILRAAEHDEPGAAACFAAVLKAPASAMTEPSRVALRRIYERQGHSDLTFEQFAAAQKWQLPAAGVPLTATPIAAHYAGSEACRACHAKQFDNWRQTGMAKMFRPYRAEDVMGDFSGRQTVSGAARAMESGTRRFIELRDRDTGNWVRYSIDFLIGSKWQQAYASRLSTGEIVVLPIQYSRIEGAWVNYWKIVDGGVSTRSDLSHFQGAPDGALYQRDCAPCHTSQLRYPSPAAPSAAAAFREGGVDCEMCHGPSREHIEAVRAGTPAAPRPASLPPVNFSHLAPEQSVAICAQCHMQSAIHDPAPGGAVNYAEGKAPFYRTYSLHLLSDFTRKAFYADGRFRATTFIGEAFQRSRCFREGGATCVSCHSPHADAAAANPKSLRFAVDSDQMCLQCHASLGQYPERHTHHAPATEASRCVSCHMPRNMDALLFRARSHQIDEIPDAQMTARFGKNESPNACLACHGDRDGEWLLKQMQAWRAGG